MAKALSIIAVVFAFVTAASSLTRDDRSLQAEPAACEFTALGDIASCG